jgi:hypothetical protein
MTDFNKYKHNRLCEILEEDYDIHLGIADRFLLNQSLLKVNCWDDLITYGRNHLVDMGYDSTKLRQGYNNSLEFSEKLRKDLWQTFNYRKKEKNI